MRSPETDELSRLLTTIGSLGESRDAEVVLLRGHLALERALALGVAKRLEVPVDKLPGMAFSTLARIATTDEAEQQELIWFNELRNCLAHELDAFSSRGFATLVGHFSVPWPAGGLERGITLEIIGNKLFYTAVAASLRWEFSSRREILPRDKTEQEAKRILRRLAASETPDEKLAADLRQFVDKMESIRGDMQHLRREKRAAVKEMQKIIQAERKEVQQNLELIRSEKWEVLIAKLRPTPPLKAVD